jgi:acyl dehydratase
MAMDYMSELMTGVFQKEWFEFAGVSATFLRPMLCGDTITVNGRLAEEVEEGAVLRKVYDLWAENQRGETAAAGRAQALVMPGR